MKRVDIGKIRRMHRAEEQRRRILRGEISLRPDARIVRIVDYKARKTRQIAWGNTTDASSQPDAGN